jgi:Ras-related protein Rab-21
MNKNYIKIVLLGDGRVGKTSILKRYIENNFNEREEMTINSLYFEKEMEVNGEKFVFCIWVLFIFKIQDTAGQEKFNALTPIYYRDAKGAILVYDVSLSETFSRVKKWIEELKAFNKNTILAIAGNKCDLKKIDIDKEEIYNYAKQEDAKHFFTSAKTGEGLNEIFSYISKKIVETLPLKETKNKKLVITKKNHQNTNNPKCCK